MLLHFLLSTSSPFNLQLLLAETIQNQHLFYYRLALLISYCITNVWFFHVQIEGYVRLLRRHPMGTKDHNDITKVLTAVQAMTRVQPPIPEAPIEEAAMPAGPSTSTAPTDRKSVV